MFHRKSELYSPIVIIIKSESDSPIFNEIEDMDTSFQLKSKFTNIENFKLKRQPIRVSCELIAKGDNSIIFLEIINYSPKT